MYVGEVNEIMGYSDAEPRLWYLREIITRLQTNELFSPTAAQESSYKEALAHVARIILNESNEPPCQTGTEPKKKKKPSRKECLKGVLRVLGAMECKRIYEPPGDAEIGYYLVIRKYIRSFLAFFGSEIEPDFRENSSCVALIKGLHHVEELAELRTHLASFAASVSEMNIKNGTCKNQFVTCPFLDNVQYEQAEYKVKARSSSILTVIFY